MEKVDIKVLEKFFEYMYYADLDGVIVNHKLTKANEIILGKKYDIIASDSEGFEMRVIAYIDENTFKIFEIYDEGVLLSNSATDASEHWVKCLNDSLLTENAVEI